MADDATLKSVRSRGRRGRPTEHGLTSMRRSLAHLTTRRLDGRSAVAVAIRRWKEDVRRDLGGDLTRAQETILEAAAQSWDEWDPSEDVESPITE